MGRGWGGAGGGEGVGRDYGWVSLWSAEDVLGLGSGDGCTTLEIKTTEPHTVYFKRTNFMVCGSFLNFKKWMINNNEVRLFPVSLLPQCKETNESKIKSQVARKKLWGPGTKLRPNL